MLKKIADTLHRSCGLKQYTHWSRLRKLGDECDGITLGIVNLHSPSLLCLVPEVDPADGFKPVQYQTAQKASSTLDNDIWGKFIYGSFIRIQKYQYY